MEYVNSTIHESLHVFERPHINELPVNNNSGNKMTDK